MASFVGQQFPEKTKIEEFNSLSVHILRPGTALYKGDNQKYLDQFIRDKSVRLTRGPAFFALTPDIAAIYGITFEFTVKNEIIIVDLDDIATVRQLYQIANKKIKYIMKNNYGFKSTGKGTRVSEHEADRAFSQFLCELGINGYVLQEASTFAKGTFHREIMLCNMTNLEFSKMVTDPSTIDIEALRLKIKEDKTNKIESEKRRKMKSRSLYKISPKKTRRSPEKSSKIGYEDSSPVKTPVKKLMF